MEYAPKPGCPMCGIISTATHGSTNSPRAPSFPAGSTQPEVVWRDDNFTVYREKAYPVSSKGHLVVAFNLHVPSIYTLSSSDVPLLTSIKSVATRLLSSHIAAATTGAQSPSAFSAPPPAPPPGTKVRIGFITPPFKDNKIPVTDHLHAHAFLDPADQLGWWRGVAYSPLAWYAIDDLIAEIRESTSNNRIKSGYANRAQAPIDSVPYAGARTGTADGRDTTEPGVASADLEAAEHPRTPARSRTLTPASLSLPSQVPALRL